MKEIDLDALLKEKREEPITVSSSQVNSWLKGGIAVVGLAAYVKWLLTTKKWIMLSSISSMTLIATFVMVQLNSSSPVLEQPSRALKREVKKTQAVISPEKIESIYKETISNVGHALTYEVLKLQVKPSAQLFTAPNEFSIVAGKSMSKASAENLLLPGQFTRIEADGFVHFTLVNGSSCAIKNSIPTEEGEVPLDFSIKNGTLYLNSATDNKATDLIITVPDIEKIKLNGFCEMVTSSTFESTDLELDVNGFTNLSVDLNVKDLEIDMNGETKGSLNIKSKYLDYESNGFNNVTMECDVEQSRLEVTGFSTIKFTGSSDITVMKVSGECKLSTEEFSSQELSLMVSGGNKKIETVVTSTLDVEILGENSVVIIGSPTITSQKVSKESKLKLK